MTAAHHLTSKSIVKKTTHSLPGVCWRPSPMKSYHCIFRTPTPYGRCCGEKCRLCSRPCSLQTSIHSTWGKKYTKRLNICVQKPFILKTPDKHKLMVLISCWKLRTATEKTHFKMVKWELTSFSMQLFVKNKNPTTYAWTSENPLKPETNICSVVTWLSRFLVSAFNLFAFSEFCFFCISSSDISLWREQRKE